MNKQHQGSRKMMAAVYARFSTDQQNPKSADDQIKACTAWAVKNGHSVAATYKDEAISGTLFFERHGLQELLADAELGRFEVVIAESQDRLSRDPEHIQHIFKYLTWHNIEIITLTDGRADDVNVAVKGIMAAYYIKNMSEKTKRGIEQALARGMLPSATSYGYRLRWEFDEHGNRKPGVHCIEPEEAAIVAEIFQRYVAGESPKAIARDLNRRGIPAPRGSLWGPSTIYGNRGRETGILNNSLYIGVYIYKRTSRRRNPFSGRWKVSVSKPHERVPVQKPELQIIPRPLWDKAKAAQEIRRHASDSKGRHPFWSMRRPKFILSGLLRCSHCRSRYTIISREYACARSIRHTCRQTKTLKREALERIVITKLIDHLEVTGIAKKCWIVAKQVVDEARRHCTTTAEPLRKRQAHIDAKLKKLVDILERQDTTFEQLQDRIDALRRERASIMQELRLTEALASSHDDLIFSEHELPTLLNATLSSTISDATKSAFRSLIEEIQIKEEGPNVAIEIKICPTTLISQSSGPGDVPLSAAQIKLVAGRGFEPLTFRL